MPTQKDDRKKPQRERDRTGGLGLPQDYEVGFMGRRGMNSNNRDWENKNVPAQASGK